MARFRGVVGYGIAVEDPPGSGVWVDDIVEHTYSGDVNRKSRTLQEAEKVNSDISIGNTFSVVADEFAFEHFANIKYVKWVGEYWIVTTVEVQAPRLILNAGGVYNGPKA